MVKKKAKVKKYKSLQTATVGRRVTGSYASRKVSTAVSRAGRGGGGIASAAQALNNVASIVRTINGKKTPIKKGKNK